MTLTELVEKITIELGEDCPIFADDANIYLIGANPKHVKELSERYKYDLVGLEYALSAVPEKYLLKISRISYRLN